MPVASENLAFGDALRPAKADFVEIEVGMLGTDVMKDTGHRALHPQIEALDRIGVNRAANIFAPPMLNGLVCGETLTNRDKRLPLVAHQVGPRVDLFLGARVRLHPARDWRPPWPGHRRQARPAQLCWVAAPPPEPAALWSAANPCDHDPAAARQASSSVVRRERIRRSQPCRRSGFRARASGAGHVPCARPSAGSPQAPRPSEWRTAPCPTAGSATAL